MKKPSITISRGFRGMLSRKTIASLPPLLSSRAISLLSTAYPERAFSSSTKLSAIYQLWLSQKKSEGKLLREAAKMMADLQRLHYFEVQRGLGKPARKGASRRKPPIHRIPLQAMHYSGQLREKLARLGITDQSTISRLEKTIGAEELELRVDGALDTFSGRELVGKQIFSRRPEILIQNEDNFFDCLDGFKVRMKTVDRLREKSAEKNVKMPSQYDYLEKPEILLNDDFLYSIYTALVQKSIKAKGA